MRRSVLPDPAGDSTIKLPEVLRASSRIFWSGIGRTANGSTPYPRSCCLLLFVLQNRKAWEKDNTHRLPDFVVKKVVAGGLLCKSLSKAPRAVSSPLPSSLLKNPPSPHFSGQIVSRLRPSSRRCTPLASVPS